MESLGSVACIPDDLLDFSFDIDEEDDDEHTKPNKRPRNAFSCLNPNGPDSTSLDVFQHDDSSPEYEELEWLENKDSFPTLETFVEVPNPSFFKQQSPISVLENSNSSTSSSTNGSTITNNTNHGNSIIMNCCDNIRVPVRARSKRRTRRRELQNHDSWWGIQENVKTVKPVVSKMIIGRKCQHCGAEKTPQWRAGPLGPKTLCNACGVRYKSGRLVPEYRPASSPTFSSELHSNSHRKVLEMRRQKQLMGLELGLVGVKPVEKG